MKTIFLRVVEAQHKASALLKTLRFPDHGQGPTRFDVCYETFSSLPGSPFAYWVGEKLLRIFHDNTPFESLDRKSVIGLKTSDDFRFIRNWFEVPSPDRHSRWVPYTRGGSRSFAYRDLVAAVQWQGDGDELRAYYEKNAKRTGGMLKNRDNYFRPGLSWPLRGIRFSAQAVPAEAIFSIAGKIALVPQEELLTWLAVFNSLPFDYIIRIRAGKVGGVQYESGLINTTAVPNTSHSDRVALSALVHRAWSLKHSLDTVNETSHAFVLPAAVLATELGSDLSAAFGPVTGDEGPLTIDLKNWHSYVNRTERELAAIQHEIDDMCFDLYGITGEDRRQIEEGFGTKPDDSKTEDEHRGGQESSEPEEVNPAPQATSLMSWATGVSLGRFDLRLATGELGLPDEPEPFDPLPICSPGMLVDDNGLPLEVMPDDYAVRFPMDGILVDDPGHERDINAVTQAVIQQIYPDETSEVLEQIAGWLGARDASTRDWFARSFFEFHIKQYSKRRRIAPIYWQLATPSASYSVWLYYHRFTKDTLFRALNEYVEPKVKYEETKLAQMRQDLGPELSTSQRNKLEAQEAFVDELRGFRQELTRVAPLWNPDLNDGVIINFAPLWRLVPQHRQWQKECKVCWDKLVAGDYDWAHLVMQLWPERVVPKCLDDRSLAIAHGLEDEFWIENDNGKWHQRQVDETTVERLIGERTSTAVNAALDDLLSAPVLTTGGTRRTRGRKAKSAAPKQRATLFREETKAKSASAPTVDDNVLGTVRKAISQVAGGASRADVLAASGLSDGEWNRAIAALLERGDVTRTGQKRGTKYHASESKGGTNA